MVDVEKLLAAITETEQMYVPDEPEDEFDVVIPKGEELHTLACAKYMTGQNAKCSCTTPAAVLRRCIADRSLVEFWSRAYSKPTDFPGPRWDLVRANARWTVERIALAYGISAEESKA